jgi:hypothetical protein
MKIMWKSLIGRRCKQKDWISTCLRKDHQINLVPEGAQLYAPSLITCRRMKEDQKRVKKENIYESLGKEKEIGQKENISHNLFDSRLDALPTSKHTHKNMGPRNNKFVMNKP